MYYSTHLLCIVTLLTGADANLKNDRVRNSTPLHWASEGGHVDVIKWVVVMVVVVMMMVMMMMMMTAADSL